MSAQTRRTCGFALLIVAFSAVSARAAWIGATAGTGNDLAHSYSTNANWGGGTPESTFNPALFGATALYFSANWSTTGTWNIAYTGDYPLTLQGGGTFDADGNNVVPSANHTVNLGGNMSIGTATSSQTVTLGSTTANFGLNISLGSTPRTITTVRGAGASPDVQILGVISSGLGSTLVLAGSTNPAGSLLLSNGNNTFTCPVYVNAGTLLLGANATSGAGNTVLGPGSATVYVGDIAGTGQNAALLTYGAYGVSRNITVRADNTGTIALGGVQTSGTSSFTGTISLGKDVTLQALGSSEVAFTGALQGDPAANVAIAGGGTVKLGGLNTYSGGTTVKTGGTAKITGKITQTSGVTIQPGANLELAGAAGSPLAGTSTVTNNGALLVSQPAAAGTIGGLGATTVNSSLTVGSIVQDTLTIGAGGAVTIRPSAAAEGAGSGAAGAVPEPGAIALLLSAAAAAAAALFSAKR